MAGDLKGANRMSAGFVQQADADPRLQQMLTLYKQPATIRDMKQVYFYSSVVANSTSIDPILQQFGYDITALGGVTNTGGINKLFSSYYGKLGTTRRLDISSVISDLIDIRVPKDKYVVEINLAECSLEVDSNGWTSLPDFVIRFGQKIDTKDSSPTNTFEVNRDPTYNWSLEDGAIGAQTPPRYVSNNGLRRARKLTEPQSLYIKIKELDNGEPYNWSVTNSGNYSIDKSHQLLVRHGDVNFANLTLEFGHLVHEGIDVDDFNFIRDRRFNDPLTFDYLNRNVESTINPIKGRLLPINIQNYSKYKYVDYNREVFNVVGSQSSADTGMYSSFAYNSTNEYPLAIYPRMYGGSDPDFCFNKGVADYENVNLISNLSDNIQRPANRPPFRFAGQKDAGNKQPALPLGQDVYQSKQPNGFVSTDAGYTEDPYLIQGHPLLFNQQASRINFRWLIRVLHLF